MNLNLATIRIKNLRLRTYIGINEDEIKNQQDVFNMMRKKQRTPTTWTML
jgi:hypothetical protein